MALPPMYQTVLYTLGLLALPLTLISPDLLFSALPIFLIVGTLQPLLTQDIEAGIRRFALAAFGFAYLPLLLGHLLLIHAWLPGWDRGAAAGHRLCDGALGCRRSRWAR